MARQSRKQKTVQELQEICQRAEDHVNQILVQRRKMTAKWHKEFHALLQEYFSVLLGIPDGPERARGEAGFPRLAAYYQARCLCPDSHLSAEGHVYDAWLQRWKQDGLPSETEVRHLRDCVMFATRYLVDEPARANQQRRVCEHLQREAAETERKRRLEDAVLLMAEAAGRPVVTDDGTRDIADTPWEHPELALRKSTREVWYGGKQIQLRNRPAAAFAFLSVLAQEYPGLALYRLIDKALDAASSLEGFSATFAERNEARSAVREGFKRAGLLQDFDRLVENQKQIGYRLVCKCRPLILD